MRSLPCLFLGIADSRELSHNFSWVGSVSLDLAFKKDCLGEKFFFLLSLLYINFRPEIRQDYPPNLSILISGGKENNSDALSNGE